MSKHNEVECKYCGDDCYWQDDTLMSLDTDEPHRCVAGLDNEEEVDFENVY